MTRKYVIIKKRINDGVYDLVYLDYKVIDEIKIIKKAEKLLKQKIKKEGRIHHPVLEENTVIDIIQIVI